MNQISYRKATIDDCLVLAQLKGQIWNTTYKGIYSDETLTNYDIPKNQRIFEQIVCNPDIELYVATAVNQIVGFMTCGKPYKPYRNFQQEIGLLYILQDYQRQGIGRYFFKLARQQVQESGHDEFLVSVNIKNLNAIAFYHSMGGDIIDTENTQHKIRVHV